MSQQQKIEKMLVGNGGEYLVGKKVRFIDYITFSSNIFAIFFVWIIQLLYTI